MLDRVRGWIGMASGENGSVGSPITQITISVPDGGVTRLRLQDVGSQFDTTNLLQTEGEIRTYIGLGEGNPYAGKFLELLEGYVLGKKGMKIHLSDPIAQMAWEEWQENCEYTGEMSWLDLEQNVLRGVARDGEVFVCPLLVPTLDGKLELKLRLRPALACPLDDMERRGIAHTVAGRPLTYYFYRDPDPETEQQFLRSDPSALLEAVDASMCWHIFRRDFITQKRGVSWMRKSRYHLMKLQRYENNMFSAADYAARAQVYMKTRPDVEYPEIEEKEDELTGENPDPQQVGDAQNYGRGVELDAHPAGRYFNAEAFPRVWGVYIKAVAAGFGISYHALVSDPATGNMASLRLLHEDDIKLFEKTQELLRAKFVWKAFLLWSSLHADGRLGRRIRTSEIVWDYPQFKYIDPLKEAVSFEKYVEMGTMSRSQVAREIGYDPVQMFAEIESDPPLPEHHPGRRPGNSGGNSTIG